MQREELGDTETRLLEKKELKKLSPVLGDKVKGARYRPSDGCLDPFKLTHAMLGKAIENGADVHIWTNVEEILFKDHTVTGVRTDSGVIESGTVINATNGWAAFLTPDIPVIPLRSL